MTMHTMSSTMERRRLLIGLGGLCLSPWSALSGCMTTPSNVAQPWEPRLRGNAVVLLGEVHDNPELHGRRTAVLRRALEAGWRPAVVMEQFDIDRQADIDRARRDRPKDVGYLIEEAPPSPGGWDWDNYKSVLELVLQHDLPLLAGNLPNAQTAQLVRQDYAAVLGEARVQALGLQRPIDAAWQSAQEHEIDTGHCGMLPRDKWAGMTRAQFARDASMADVLRRHADQGVVLLAGNGHVRRDIAVPRWLDSLPPERLWAVGFVEEGDGSPASAFDAVVTAPQAEREDPCAAFTKRRAG